MRRGTSALASIAAALTLVACGGGQRAAARTPDPAKHTVTIEAMRFAPERLTVKPGDIVVWINKDLVPHTATSEQGRFDSATIDPAASWQMTAGSKGAFDYVCRFHLTMKGTLVVE